MKPTKIITPEQMDQMDSSANEFISLLIGSKPQSCSARSEVVCILDSNIWMNADYNDFLDALKEVFYCNKKKVLCLGAQLDEIENKKTQQDSPEARQGLRALQSFQKLDVVDIVGVRTTAKKDAYADPEIVSTVKSLLDQGQHVILFTDDRALSIRAKEILNNRRLRILSVADIQQQFNSYRNVRSMYFNRTDSIFLQRNSCCFYIFRSVHSGKVFDLMEHTSIFSPLEMRNTLGAKTQQWDYWGARNQLFAIRESSKEPDIRHIQAWRSPLMDWSGGYLAAKRQENGSELTCQKEPYAWKLIKEWGGAFLIQSADSNLVVDIEASSLANGARLHLWNKHDGMNQRWRIQACAELNND